MDLQELRKQMKFLRKNIQNFEEDSEFAIQIAVVVRTLVHDTRFSISLLNRLDIKYDVNYYDTSAPEWEFPYDNFSIWTGDDIYFDDYKNSVPYRWLVAELHNNEIKSFRPFFLHLQEGWFDSSEHLVSNFNDIGFDEWWEWEIYKDDLSISRSFLIKMAANKDWGAHFDNLPLEYINIKFEQIERPEWYSPNEYENSPLYSTICQIWWELLKSLELYISRIES